MKNSKSSTNDSSSNGMRKSVLKRSLSANAEDSNGSSASSLQVKEVRSSVSEAEGDDLEDCDHSGTVRPAGSSESLGSQDSGLGSSQGCSSQDDLAAKSGSESDDSHSHEGQQDSSKEKANKALQALLCTFCCVRPKDACFVHGKISHQVCCYPCAKKLYKQKGTCPVCRRKIEKITKNIMV